MARWPSSRALSSGVLPSRLDCTRTQRHRVAASQQRVYPPDDVTDTQSQLACPRPHRCARPHAHAHICIQAQVSVQTRMPSQRWRQRRTNPPPTHTPCAGSRPPARAASRPPCGRRSTRSAWANRRTSPPSSRPRCSR
jgi:hypothetical protein